MEDIFGNLDNIDILGTPTNKNTPQAGLGVTDNVNDSINHEQKTKQKAFKIVVVGDPQVGKTTFLTKHLNGSFDSTYRATIGASTFHLQFNTNLDMHKYECLDIAGQYIFSGKRDSHYKDICGAIIMYDVMNWASYDNVTDVWLRELRQLAPSDIPIVVVGNKMENRDTRAVSVEVVAEAIQNEFEPKRIGYCEVSVKTNQNLAEPFLFLTKRLLNINDSKALYFVSKISELNLIESMLQHQKDKDIKAKTPKINAPTSTESQSQNLDDLFLNDTPNVDVNNNNNNNDNNNNGNTKQATMGGGDDYFDAIFKLGDSSPTNKVNKEPESKIQSIVNDDNFIANMMAQPNISKSKSKPSPMMTSTTTTSMNRSPKAKSVTPKMQSNTISKAPQSQQRNRANSTQTASMIVTDSNNKKSGVVNKSRQSSSSRNNKRGIENSNSDVMIDILLGIQESINNLSSEVRRLQNDVNYIKQSMQRR